MAIVEFIKENQDLLTSLGSLSNLGFLLTSVIALVKWVANEREKRRLEQERVYTEINDRYISYLELALSYPHLDVADFSVAGGQPRTLAPEEQLQQKIMFSMLTSILERTYMYMQTVLGKKNEEWLGWDSWVDMWLNKPSYRAFWERPGGKGVFVPSGQYLPDFEKYMESKYYATKPRVVGAPHGAFAAL